MTAPRLLPTLTLVLLAACGRDGERPGIPPKHVILITVGGLRADHTSAFPYSRETTALPFTEQQVAEGRALAIDDLAAAGILFAQAFAPTTDPLDALAATLTGSHPRSGSADPATIHAALHRAGMATAGFVSWPEDRTWAADLSEELDHHERVPTDREAVDAAVEFIGQQDFDDGRGRLLWVHLDGPTFPLEPGVAPSILGERDHAALFTDPGYEESADVGANPTEADRQHIVALYDGEVAQTNALVSYLLDRYREQGATADAWERTLTVVVGTHGVALFDPEEEGRHGPARTLADPELHVPLILRHPRSTTGRRILKEVVETTNVKPTILDWFGVARGDDRSLLALMDSHVQRTFDRRPALAFDGSGSARTADWRLLLSEREPPRLWPVEGLRQRAENLAALHPEVVDELASQLEALRRRSATDGPDWRR